MNRITKKLIVAAFLIVTLLIPSVDRANAAFAKKGRTICNSFDSYYHSSKRKLLITVGQYTYGSYWYKINVYDANPYYTYSYQICQLNMPFVVNNEWKSYNTSGQNISATQGVTISQTDATTTSHTVNVGIEAKMTYEVVKQKFEVGLNVGYSYTNSKTQSHTITRSESQTYSTTLTDATPNGIYYYAAIRDYDAQEVEVFSKRAYSNDAWKNSDNYTIFMNRHNYATIKLVKDPL